MKKTIKKVDEAKAESLEKEGLLLERLKVGICEDNLEERIRLLRMVAEAAKSASVEAYESAESLLGIFYPGKFDLLILDIYMAGMTGIDALKKIREKDSRVIAAIATMSQDFALESYRLHAVRYLEKPVRKEGIEELLLFVAMKKDAEPHYEVGSGSARIRIPFDRLLYVEQQGRSLHIYLENEEEVTLRGTLDKEEEKFQGHNFYRCHKSYLVNLAKICSIDRELRTFVMEDGAHVHISRQCFSAAKHAYEHYLFSLAEGSIKSENVACTAD